MPKKKNFTGLGVDGYGKILKKRKNETMAEFVERQNKEFGI